MTIKPAARKTDLVDCPGHTSSPIATGSPDVFFDGLPAAREGDVTACGGQLEGQVIDNILVNGKKLIVQGDATSHGGIVIGGSGTVFVGSHVIGAPQTPIAPECITEAFNDYLVVRDTHTRVPLCGRAYTLTTDSGQTLTGITDNQGRTQRIASGKAENATLALAPQTVLVTD